MATKIIVTGGNGFLARNLVQSLKVHTGFDFDTITREDDKTSISKKLQGSQVIFHLAGVNRPIDDSMFDADNVQFTQELFELRQRLPGRFSFIFTSSIQAALGNWYGVSKRRSEEYLERQGSTACIYILRLPNVFGKWCRPNYNSVVATFCHSIARDLPIEISDPSRLLRLVYIDDVVNTLLTCISNRFAFGVHYVEVTPVYSISVLDLAEIIRSFRSERTTLLLPKLEDKAINKLYSTYLSYLPIGDLSYPLNPKQDDRGRLVELIKSSSAGQLFFSTTKPGITRGDHFHNTKVEKFIVIQGVGMIKLRNIVTNEVATYTVRGDNPEVVNIPPGYTHNISNIGLEDMVTLFWANEIFDSGHPDTYNLKV